MQPPGRSGLAIGKENHTKYIYYYLDTAKLRSTFVGYGVTVAHFVVAEEAEVRLLVPEKWNFVFFAPTRVPQSEMKSAARGNFWSAMLLVVLRGSLWRRRQPISRVCWKQIEAQSHLDLESRI